MSAAREWSTASFPHPVPAPLEDPLELTDADVMAELELLRASTVVAMRHSRLEVVRVGLITRIAALDRALDAVHRRNHVAG